MLADITRILADREISIDAMIQKEPSEGEDQTDIILLTHQSIEKNVVDAIAKIEALPTVRGKVVRIRLEELTERRRLMRYVSTRGAWARRRRSRFRAILLEGLAPDGGLAVPADAIRASARAELAALRAARLSRARVRDAVALHRRHPAGRPARRSIDRTYTRGDLRQRRHHAAADARARRCHLLRVSNGPTLAFKDIALQLLGNLFEYVLAQGRARRSTSSARRRATPAASAEYAMRGKRGIARVHAVAARAG